MVVPVDDVVRAADTSGGSGRSVEVWDTLYSRIVQGAEKAERPSVVDHGHIAGTHY